MKNVLLCISLTLLGSQAFAQIYQSPKAEANKAVEDSWAAAVKAKAANDAAVAAQKAAEAAKKVPPETKLEVHIYDGKGGKAIPK